MLAVTVMVDHCSVAPAATTTSGCHGVSDTPTLAGPTCASGPSDSKLQHVGLAAATTTDRHTVVEPEAMAGPL